LRGNFLKGRPWLPALLVLPMFAGFAFFGVQVGTVTSGLTIAVIVYLAVRAESDGPIEVADPGPGVPGGVLVIATTAIEDPRTASIVAAIGDPSRPESGDRGLLVLAPARSSRLDRWADDLESARFESQRVLTVSLATMAAAGIVAEGRVGDGDVVLAAEDTLRSYAATEVVVVAREGTFERELEKLERRLQQPLRRVTA
jgi:hypothetical protein